MSGEHYRPPFLDLLEAVFCYGLYEEFKRKAHEEGRPFTVSKGKFVHDIANYLDLKYSSQQNGHAPRKEPIIKYAYR